MLGHRGAVQAVLSMLSLCACGSDAELTPSGSDRIPPRSAVDHALKLTHDKIPRGDALGHVEPERGRSSSIDSQSLRVRIESSIVTHCVLVLDRLDSVVQASLASAQSIWFIVVRAARHSPWPTTRVTAEQFRKVAKTVWRAPAEVLSRTGLRVLAGSRYMGLRDRAAFEEVLRRRPLLCSWVLILPLRTLRNLPSPHAAECVRLKSVLNGGP